MVRSRAFLTLLVGVVLAAAASARTFTSSKGIEVEAEIESANDSTVTLKLADTSTITVGLDQFIQADQEHIRSWLAAQVPAIEITPKFDHSIHGRGLAGGAGSPKHRQVQFLDMSVEIETRNQSVGVEDGELTCILVGRCMDNRDRYKILAIQTAAFKLPPSGRTRTTFKTVQNFFDDTPGRERGSLCIGYVLRAVRRSDQRELHASAAPSLLREAIPAILALETGEVTDDRFVRIPKSANPTAGGESGVTTIE